jgi:hypothetical protein
MVSDEGLEWRYVSYLNGAVRGVVGLVETVEG